MAALTAAAVAMKTADPADPRSIGQRRADALAEIGWAALATGRLDPHPHTCRPPEPGSEADAADRDADVAAGGRAGGADDPAGGAGPADSCGDSPATGDGYGGTAAPCGCAGRLARAAVIGRWRWG